MSGAAGSSSVTNPTMVSLTEAQFQALLTNTRPSPAEERTTRLKPEKPPTFNGDRTKLRSFLVLCRVYYEANRVTEDRTKITFTETLLRDAAARWLTPYAEGKKDKTWDTYQALEDVLRIQFGDPDAEGTARNKIERLKQGNDTITEFWNTFRLLSTDANMDDGTLQRYFLKGMSGELQDAWPRSQVRHQTVEELANWAVKQENRMATIKQIRQSKTPIKTSEVPRSPNGTFRSSFQPDNRGDPMEIDATRNRNRLPIPGVEYRRRMSQGLCIKCAQKGHLVKDCKNPINTKTLTPQTRNSQNWRQQQPRFQAREISAPITEEKREESGNEESPQ